MEKLSERLERQLKTEYKEDAENCIKIYNALKERTGHVWKSQWNVLVNTTYEGFPSDKRRFKPSNLGNMFLKGLKE